MPNKQFSISLSLNHSVILSVLLHGGLFALAFGMAVSNSVPLPLGVELQYGVESSVTAPQLKSANPISKAPAAPAKTSDGGPAEKIEKKTVTASPAIAETQSLGTTAGASDSGALQGREGVANGSEVTPEQRYLYEIKKLLERRKRYPMLAKKMGQTGKVTMRFTLAQDGSLLASEILEKTPFDSLNQAAHELVKGLHGLKPFPEEIQKTSWSITVPIEYVLN